MDQPDDDQRTAVQQQSSADRLLASSSKSFMAAYYGYFRQCSLDKAIKCVENAVQCAILSKEYGYALHCYESMIRDLNAVRPRYQDETVVQYFLLKLINGSVEADHERTQTQLESFDFRSDSAVFRYLNNAVKIIRSGQNQGELFQITEIPHNIYIFQLLYVLLQKKTV